MSDVVAAKALAEKTASDLRAQDVDGVFVVVMYRSDRDVLVASSLQGNIATDTTIGIIVQTLGTLRASLLSLRTKETLTGPDSVGIQKTTEGT
jgi:hypothetical protein